MENNLPKAFWDRIKEIYSTEDIEIIKKWFSTEKRDTTFRVNTLKITEEEAIEKLEQLQFEIEKVPYIDNCYKIVNNNGKRIADMSLFRKGQIYLQQISSQIPVHFLDLKEGSKVLDTTAAPGSKTSQIAMKLNNTGEIIACDNNAIRVEKLNYTIAKQWVLNTQVFKTDARKLEEPLSEYLQTQGWTENETKEYFDSILFDAPCTSEWRINFHKEKSYGFWKEDIFKKHYRISKSILEKIIPLLKKWGTLVFSTCTLAPEENEAAVHFILSNYPELELVKMDLESPYVRPGLKQFGKQHFRKEIVNTIRYLPSVENEGFYIAKFRKKA